MKKITLNFLMFFSLLSFITKGQVIPKPCQTADLTFNGNFALTGGIQSQLTQSAACVHSTYSVNTNLNTKCSGWPNVPDHTPGGGTKMLICDGFETLYSSKYVWKQTYNVCAGKTYTFSFWTNSVYSGPFNLTMSLVGSSQGPIPTVNTSNLAQAWTYHQRVWTAVANGTLAVEIQQNTQGIDRDFAIDDVSFRYCCPPISASASQTICAGTTVTLAATGATSYTWYPGAITGSSIVVTPGSTTTYTVKGMGGCACSPSLVSTTTTVTVLPNAILDPNFTIGGDDISATDYTIHAIPVSTPPGFWWEVSEINPATGAVIPNTTMTNAQTWWYSPFITYNTFPTYNVHFPNNTAWATGSPFPTPPYGGGAGTPVPGFFSLCKTYRITRGTWGPCTPAVNYF
ncbi:MAG: hypothetical protein IPJ32_00210 [Sphingobacteriaceae bacterium]|nr:hypothetical protein [Sphingobacteriaceae bacterium]